MPMPVSNGFFFGQARPCRACLGQHVGLALDQAVDRDYPVDLRLLALDVLVAVGVQDLSE